MPQLLRSLNKPSLLPLNRSAFTLGAQILVVGNGELVVSAVVAEGAAEAAGLCIGDTILEIDRNQVRTLDEVDRLLTAACGCPSICVKVRLAVSGDVEQVRIYQSIQDDHLPFRMDASAARIRSGLHNRTHPLADLTNKFEKSDPENDFDAISCASTETRSSLQNLSAPKRHVREEKRSSSRFDDSIRKVSRSEASQAILRKSTKLSKQDSLSGECRPSGWLNGLDWSGDSTSDCELPQEWESPSSKLSLVEHAFICAPSITQSKFDSNQSSLRSTPQQSCNNYDRLSQSQDRVERGVETRHLRDLLKQGYEIIDQLRQQITTACVAETEAKDSCKHATNQCAELTRKNELLVSELWAARNMLKPTSNEALDDMTDAVHFKGRNNPAFDCECDAESFRKLEQELMASNTLVNHLTEQNRLLTTRCSELQLEISGMCIRREEAARNSQNCDGIHQMLLLQKSALEQELIQLRKYLVNHLHDSTEKFWKATLQVNELLEEMRNLSQEFKQIETEATSYFTAHALHENIAQSHISKLSEQNRLIGSQLDHMNIQNSSLLRDIELHTNAISCQERVFQEQVTDLESKLKSKDLMVIELVDANNALKTDRAVLVESGFIQLQAIENKLQVSLPKLTQLSMINDSLNATRTSMEANLCLEQVKNYESLLRLQDASLEISHEISEVINELHMLECSLNEAQSRMGVDREAETQTESWGGREKSELDCEVTDMIGLQNMVKDFKEAIMAKENHICQLMGQLEELRNGKLHMAKSSSSNRLDKEIRRLRAALEGNEAGSKRREELIQQLRNENDALRNNIIPQNEGMHPTQLSPIRENVNECSLSDVSRFRETITSLTRQLEDARIENELCARNLAAEKAGHCNEIQNLHLVIGDLETRLRDLRGTFLTQLNCTYVETQQECCSGISGQQPGEGLCSQNTKMQRIVRIAEQAVAAASSRDEAMRAVQAKLICTERRCEALQATLNDLEMFRDAAIKSRNELIRAHNREIAGRDREVSWLAAHASTMKEEKYGSNTHRNEKRLAIDGERKYEIVTNEHEMADKVVTKVPHVPQAAILDDKVYFI